MRLIIFALGLCLLSACAYDKQVSTWDIVQVRRLAEAAEASAQKTERMVRELQSRNVRLEELVLELRRKAEIAEKKENEFGEKAGLPRVLSR